MIIDFVPEFVNDIIFVPGLLEITCLPSSPQKSFSNFFLINSITVITKYKFQMIAV